MDSFEERYVWPHLERFPKWVTANMLTIIRGLHVAPQIWLRSHPFFAVVTLILSSYFDFMDGPLHRLRLNQLKLGVIQRLPTSWIPVSGAFLDATSDKVYILGTLWFGCDDPRVWFPLRVAITSLEVALTLIRPIKRLCHAPEDSNKWGKRKMWVQSFGLAFVLTALPYVLHLGIALLCISLLPALLSFGYHVRDLYLAIVKKLFAHGIAT